MKDCFDNPFKWQLFDYMVTFLETHTTMDLFELLYDAIYMRASQMIKEDEGKHAMSHGQLGKIVDYCLGHIIPQDCDRHNKLFKNISIWCVNSGFSDKIIDQIDKQITENCPGRKSGEIKGWIRFAREERREVNLKEIEDVVKLVEGKNGGR